MSSKVKLCGSTKSVSASFIWELSANELNIDEKECEGDANDLFILSPIFHAFNNTFYLRLDPKHLIADDNYVAIGLVCKNITNIELQCSISLIDIYGQKLITKTLEGKFIGGRNPNGQLITNYITRSELISHRHYLFENDNMKIFCEMIVINIVNHREYIDFCNLLNNEQFSDVKINVKGKELYAHKVFLASKSDVFKAMFTHEMKENLEKSIQITDIDYDIVMEMLRFMYTGQVNGIDEVAKQLIFAAEKYNIAGLKLICSKYLAANLSVDNVVECLNIADKCNIDMLKTAGLNFISSNAKEMAKSPEFKSVVKLNEELVFEVMKHLALGKSS